mmetsp:Transcript_7506/g.18969  ORF Transcript_7506/g.18969 Transcript_7506/m.18969 type:complete len:540 (+) Transcript_7506:143-1762(+)
MTTEEPPSTPGRGRKSTPAAAAYDWGARTPEPPISCDFSAYDWGLRTPEPSKPRSCPASAGGEWDLDLPRGSPNPRSSPCQYSDRYIPNRAALDFETGLALLDVESENERSNVVGSAGGAGVAAAARADDENSVAYWRLLRGELLGQSPQPGSSSSNDRITPMTPDRRGLFKYKAPFELAEDDTLTPLKLRALGTEAASPDGSTSKAMRKVAKEPFRVLHAPDLQDDFYLNCLDNSISDVLAVGFGRTVDLWSARTGRSTRLCELGRIGCTSVRWSPHGTHLAVGRHNGEVQIWDVAAQRHVRTMSGHLRRVAALAWNGETLTTGSRDHEILHRDFRQASHHYARLQGHAQEVCGLSWSPDGQQLASGGNEGHVCVWSASRASGQTPLHRFTEHVAAVKALVWSPHQRGLLATGGGTADKCIRFWGTSGAGSAVASLFTGSQVCNLAWSRNVDEIVSTHGYSGNEIVLWRYPSMTRVATLTGHTARTLYLAVSADGQVIITGAGDETLRFWNVFPGASRRVGSGLDLRTGPTSLTKIIR